MLRVQAETPGYTAHESGMYIQAPSLLRLPWLRHAATKRHFTYREALRREELRDLQTRLSIPPFPVVYAQQRHTNHVGLVDDIVVNHLSSDGRFIFKDTDAIACARPGITLAIFTADCVPVFLVDIETRAIALAHAGWQGTLARIAGKAIDAMLSLGSDPSDIVAWIGPCIGGCCYEVSIDLADRFRAEFHDAVESGVEFCRERMLDLVALNVFQLQSAGVLRSAISTSGLCTLDERETFYSYRGDGGPTGRIISTMTVIPSVAHE